MMDNIIENPTPQRKSLMDRLKQFKTASAVGVLVFILVIGVVIYRYNTTYAEAKADLAGIENLIAQKSYGQAMTGLKDFTITHSIVKFNNLAKQKIKELDALAENKYIDGIKQISTDKSELYSSTESYFKGYKLDFPFSSRISDVDTLLSKIKELKESTTKYNDLKTSQTYINANVDLITAIEKYVDEGKYIHKLAYDVVYNKSRDAESTIFSEFSRKMDYYNSIGKDLSTIQGKDVKGTLFTPDEYESIKKFIGSAFMPAMAVYGEMLSANSLPAEKVRNSWSIYDSLESKVNTIISTKKFIVNNYDSSIKGLEEEIKKLNNDIQGYSGSKSGLF